MENVSAMLGHKNFKTTQIYAKVLQQKIADDMKKLQTLLSAIHRRLTQIEFPLNAPALRCSKP